MPEMSKEGKFAVYCLEQYRTDKKLSGKQASELFAKYDVWQYIYRWFDALHTTGAKYIINDIDEYMHERNPIANI